MKNRSNGVSGGSAAITDGAAAITRQEYRQLGAHYHGYHPRGLSELRERLATMYCEEGLPTSADQILITSGAQQAIELITSKGGEVGKPLVVRLDGNNADEGRRILDDAEHDIVELVDTMDGAARRAAELAAAEV